jgi:hypothetical protein
MDDSFMSKDASNTTRIPVAAGAALTLIGATLALTAPFVVLKTPLPYMATPAKKVKRALSSLPAIAKRGTFVDLGSGDGTTLYQAHCAGFQRAIGYEVNWTLWGISQLRRTLFWGQGARQTVEIYCRDFFASSLPNDTSTVMVFGVTPLMKPLSMKLAKETRPGVFVLSYRFVLPIQEMGNESTRDLLKATLVYDYEEMRIYKVVNDEVEKE